MNKKISDMQNSFTHGVQNLVKLGLCGVFMLGSAAQAAPLNLVPGIPDIVSSFITVDYDAGTDALSADGFANEYNNDGIGSAEQINNGVFTLNASIDENGVLAGGTLTIAGTVPTLGLNSGTLLTGTLTDFGFPDAGGDPLEFLFDVTGGDAAPDYGSGPAGIILSFTGFGGDFTSNWGNGGATGVSDVAAVPLPAAAWLFGSALLGLVGIGRRRTQ